MTAVIRGGITVKPHVQKGCDLLEHHLGQVLSFGTYKGHSPPEGATQAVDIFNPDTAAGHALQDRICDFLIKNAKALGVRYIIRREYIWNIERAAEGWRWQGSNNNRRLDHYDHVHVTFYATASGLYVPYYPPARPSTYKESDTMFTYSTDRSVDGGSIWLVINGKAFRMHRVEDVQRIIDKGVVNFGEMSESFHNLFEHIG